MEETKIAEKLKENVPKPEFKDNEQPKPQLVEENDGSHNNLPLENMLLKQQVFDFMDIPVGARTNPETLGAIDTILEWAYKQTGSREFSDMLKVINRQEAIMGSRMRGNRVFDLYKFVKINNQMSALYEQEKALYGI